MYIRHESVLPLMEIFDPRALTSVAGDVRRAKPPGPDEQTAWDRLRTHIVESRPPGLLAAQVARAGRFVPQQTDVLAKLLFKDLGDASGS